MDFSCIFSIGSAHRVTVELLIPNYVLQCIWKFLILND